MDEINSETSGQLKDVFTSLLKVNILNVKLYYKILFTSFSVTILRPDNIIVTLLRPAIFSHWTP